MGENLQAFGCVNNTIRVRSGKYLDLRDPQPNQFDLEDIAGGLSKICRFGGQCDIFYSVAEHVCHCQKQAQVDGLDIHVQRAALMHDAAEAFIGDMVKPLKIMVPEYSVVESRMEAVIAEKFGIDFNGTARFVSKIDREMLIAERFAVFSKDKVTWTGQNEVRKIDVAFQYWGPRMAELYFMRIASTIGIANH